MNVWEPAFKREQDTNLRRIVRMFCSRLCLKHRLVFYDLKQSTRVVFDVPIGHSRFNFYADPQMVRLEDHVDSVARAQCVLCLAQYAVCRRIKKFGVREDILFERLVGFRLTTAPATGARPVRGCHGCHFGQAGQPQDVIPTAAVVQDAFIFAHQFCFLVCPRERFVAWPLVAYPDSGKASVTAGGEHHHTRQKWRSLRALCASPLDERSDAPQNMP
ncbi:hypothetical protein WT33_33435 [Burkholderia stagnalis]|nr:hypothetical protein WT33_33435 [Burkholderia stagnalis]